MKDHTLRVQLFSEQFLENIQIFVISVYLCWGSNVQEAREQLFLFMSLPWCQALTVLYLTSWAAWFLLLGQAGTRRSNTPQACPGQRVLSLLSTLAGHRAEGQAPAVGSRGTSRFRVKPGWHSKTELQEDKEGWKPVEETIHAEHSGRSWTWSSQGQAWSNSWAQEQAGGYLSDFSHLLVKA